MSMAIYARQSVDRADSISVESQLEFCRYELRGEACREYIDRGYSGKDTNRPGFGALLEDIRAGRIETVIVYKLDRISRSILDFSAMMELFQQYGVEFVSSTEKFDTSTPIGRAMLNLCVVFAQLERETIQKRVADAYHSRSKKGFYMGGRVPYGFRLADVFIGGVKTAQYEPVPGEVEQIRQMYAIYARPESSLADILRHFEAAGIDHLRGAAWSTARLSELLRNPVYVRADARVYSFFRDRGAVIVGDPADFAGGNGCYLYKGETGGSKQYDLRGKHLVLAPHQGIVPAELWLRCRKKALDNRQSAPPGKPRNSWLAGKTKCRCCGFALTIRRNSSGKRYFVCSGRRCPGPGTLRAEELEAAISREIQGKLVALGTLLPPESPAAEPQAGGSKLQLARIEAEIEALVDKVPAADAALMEHINRRVTALEGERQRYLAQTLAQTAASRNASLPGVSDPAERWARLELQDRLRAADALIEKIWIGEDAVEILWRL